MRWKCYPARARACVVLVLRNSTNNCSNKTMNRRPRRGLFPTNRCECDEETGEENQEGSIYLPDNSVLF